MEQVAARQCLGLFDAATAGPIRYQGEDKKLASQVEVRIQSPLSGLARCLEFDLGGFSLSEFAAAFDLGVQLGSEEESEPG